MPGRRLGCISGAGIIAALVTLLLIAAFGVVRGGSIFIPGPLNAQASGEALGGVRSHAETGGRCAACHTAPWAADTLADRCLACHIPIAAELDDPLTLHGALNVRQAVDGCRRCHTEHRGATANLTVIDPATFPHDATGYLLFGHGTLTGGRAFSCADCHPQDLSHFDTATCDTCHRQTDAEYMQAHSAAFGSACLDCHDGADRYGRRTFDHGVVFPLTEKHATADCAGCHPGARSVADLQAAPTACVGCHQGDDQHQGRFGADCGACHKTDSWQGATFDHSQSAFPLTGKHSQVDCVQCHTNNIYQGTPRACVGCHRGDDQHQGRFGADCGACHKTDSWQGATFDHSQSAFPLTGKHSQVDCGQCHTNNVYQGTPRACVGCHRGDDQHQGRFGADCGACHKTDSWQGATFDHSQSAFPLTGKHSQVDCGQCHTNNVYQGTPRACVGCHRGDDRHQGRFGADCGACHKTDSWQGATFDHSQSAFPLTGKHSQVDCGQCHTNNVYQGTPRACVGCHRGDDQHQGRFGADCGACHKTDSWQGATFDHSQSAFPLTGKHSQVDCGQCHTNNVYQGTPRACVGCHRGDDQHQGRFGADCGACHKTDSWQGATFDHSQSAFPLTGKHSQVDCVQCHTNNVYQGTPRACVGCHRGDDQHQGRFGADCGACHKTDSWQGATFDHSQSAFPLTGKHSQVDCGQCHTNNVYQGTPRACVGCHRGDDQHQGRFGADCGACHKTDSWQGATFDHSQSAFPLTGKHSQVDCGQCHTNNVYQGTPRACVGCHRGDDQHQGRFGADCGACHKTDSWQGATFDHSQSAFPLTGKHSQVDCGQCHTNNVYQGTPTTCVRCHQDPLYHRAAFGAACADCHTADAWRPARYDRSHTFPLGHGESGSSPCNTCHPAQVTNYTCYGCHEHTETQIAEKHREEGIFDFANCVECHPTGRKEEGDESGSD